jgi:hypothetical protein
MNFTNDQIKTAKFIIARKSFLKENFRSSYGWNGSQSICYDCDNDCNHCPYEERANNLLREKALNMLSRDYIKNIFESCPVCGSGIDIYGSPTSGFAIECRKCKIESLRIKKELKDCAEILIKSFSFYTKEVPTNASR